MNKERRHKVDTVSRKTDEQEDGHTLSMQADIQNTK